MVGCAGHLFSMWNEDVLGSTCVWHEDLKILESVNECVNCIDLKLLETIVCWWSGQTAYNLNSLL